MFRKFGSLWEKKEIVLYSNKKWNGRTRQELWIHGFSFNRFYNIFESLISWLKGRYLKGTSSYSIFHPYGGQISTKGTVLHPRMRTTVMKTKNNSPDGSFMRHLGDQVGRYLRDKETELWERRGMSLHYKGSDNKDQCSNLLVYKAWAHSPLATPTAR